MHDFTALNLFFDHIYVITLLRAKERQHTIRENLAGLKYKFFFGADKQDYSIPQLIHDGIYDEVLAKKNHRYHKTLSSGQVCCAWSHKRVYEDIIMKGFQKVLILEDDVTAVDGIGTLSTQVLSELPEGWELLYMDYTKNEKPNFLKKNWYHLQSALGALTWSQKTIENLYPVKLGTHIYTSGYHDYTSAYALTSSAAKKLIALQSPVIYLADNLLANACTTKQIEGFISRPKLFSQLSQGSDKLTHSFVDD